MGKPNALLQEANSFARDFPRDRMPEGYVWDMVDFVPVLLDAQLTGRGGWKWGSAAHSSDFVGGIYAPFKAGEKLLVVDETGYMLDVDLTTGALSSVGAVGHIVQNPVMHRDFVYVANSDGVIAKQVKLVGTTFTVTALPTTNVPLSRHAVVYKDRLVLANSVGQEQRISFSPPGDPMATVAIGGVPAGQWDPVSYWNSSLAITGLGSLRAALLLFHAGSVERLRGGIPPTTADPLGDMFMEPLFDRAGCGDARTIAYWQDNCIFADERGVHFTDGATVRNLSAQGGILTLWRQLWKNRSTVAADTYLNYYLITVVRTDGVALTLVCDLERRTWFRFNNIKSRGYIHSIGAQEQIWGCRSGGKRLMALSNCFFPTLTEIERDDDGTDVLPILETPWYRFGDEGRKRVRFVYTSYDVQTTQPSGLMAMSVGATEDDVMNWRHVDDGQAAQYANVEAQAALQQVLEIGYIRNPTDTTYALAGRLPETQDYRRYRLPISKNPYGMAFRIRQIAPSYVTRLYGLAVEASTEERSRV